MANPRVDVSAEVKKAMSAGDFVAAADIGARLLKTHSKDVFLNVVTSVAEIHAKRFSRAGARLKRLIKDVPPTNRYFTAILQNLHDYARITGDFSTVAQVLESKRQKQNADPIYSEAIANLALERLNRQGMARTYSQETYHAIRLLEQLPDHYPRAREASEVLARLYVHCEITDKAFPLLERLVADNPGDRSLRLFQLSALAMSGEVDAAIKCALALIDDFADIGPRPYLVIVYLRPSALPTQSLDVLEGFLENEQNPVIDRFQAAFALGCMAEYRDDMEAAFGYYQKGHAISRNAAPYDIEDDLSALDRIRGHLSGDEPAGQGYHPAPSEVTPIFIVGMPRSGSTLVESILGTHPDVHGAGEIGDFAQIVEDVTGSSDIADQMAKLGRAEIHEIRRRYLKVMRGYAQDAKFVVNKTLSNLVRVGVIRRVFPEAPIIHMKRHPIATCVSIYTTPFVQSMRYADDLDDLAAYHRACDALMKDFVKTDTHNMLYELDYEALVADPESVGQAFFAHCGIEWDSACLEFYRSDKAARTASMMQVRRPINPDSLAKWKRFDPYIGALASLASEEEPAKEKASQSGSRRTFAA